MPRQLYKKKFRSDITLGTRVVKLKFELELEFDKLKLKKDATYLNKFTQNACKIHPR